MNQALFKINRRDHPLIPAKQIGIAAPFLAASGYDGYAVADSGFRWPVAGQVLRRAGLNNRAKITDRPGVSHQFTASQDGNPVVAAHPGLGQRRADDPPDRH